MEDTKVYDFFLKLNTFLNRQNHLSSKMMDQETELRNSVLAAKSTLSPEVFNQVFKPMVNILENRVKTMNEMKEAAEEFTGHIHEFFEYYKGIVQ